MHSGKRVWICFNASCGNRSISSMVRAVAHTLSNKYGFSVSVFKPYRITSIDRDLGIGNLTQFMDTNPDFCAFVTAPFSKEDPVFFEVLKEATRRGFNRCGYIVKPDRENLVPEQTFIMFRRCVTEYANAIHSAREIVESIRCSVG